MVVNPRRCRFLELPAELRNNIYQHALVEVEPIRVDLTKLVEEPVSIFNLLRTCRQVRHEASALVYDNTFEFITAIHAHQEHAPNTGSLARLRKICQVERSRPHLRHVLVCLDRNLAFEYVAHHIGMLFRASEPLRELQKNEVDIAVYVSSQLCRGNNFSPRLQFALNDVEKARSQLEECFMAQRIAAGFGAGKDLKTVYFELLKSKLIDAFFLKG